MSIDNVTLGTIYLPKSGTSVGTFQFVLDKTATEVKIDTPVTAITPEGNVTGVITDMTTIGTDENPFITSYSQASSVIETPLAASYDEVKLATVQVFYAPKLRSISSGTVRGASPEEMLAATGAARIEVPVSAGVVELTENRFATIPFDAHTLLGPESAHAVIGGLSGQASKTSYAGVLLKSAFTACENNNESIAAVIFNVKGTDLINLDKPPAAGYELTDDDLAMYKAMGVPPEPFKDVVVYSPALPDGSGVRSPREDAKMLQWDLTTIWPYIRYFLPDLMSNDNMAALWGDLGARVLNSNRNPDALDTLDKLVVFLDGEISNAEDASRSSIFNNHHVATAKRVFRLLNSLPNRCGGLLTREKANPENDVNTDYFMDGSVVVIDIAGLEPLVQSAVIARTCQRILHTAEETDGDGENPLGVDHLVLFADELNIYAPQGGGEMESVRKMLTKISATGRYAGISLWGAAQFLSQVSNQVVGNAATRAAGVMSDSEVDAGVFGRLSAGQRERLVTLPKGYMAIKAYNLRGMLTVRFPRPAWATGKAKNKNATGSKKKSAIARSKVVRTLHMEDEAIDNLTNGLSREIVEEVFAEFGSDREGIIKRLEQLRTLDMSKVSVEKSSTFNPDNPWDID